MGCLWSKETIDFDFIQPIVLRIRAGLASYSGTTERGQCQVCFVSFHSINFHYLFIEDIR